MFAATFQPLGVVWCILMIKCALLFSHFITGKSAFKTDSVGCKWSKMFLLLRISQKCYMLLQPFASRTSLVQLMSVCFSTCY